LKKFLPIATVIILSLLTEQFGISKSNSNSNNYYSLVNYSIYNNANYLDPDTSTYIKFTLYINQGILNIKCSLPQELEEGDVAVFNLLGQVITRKKLESNFLNQLSLPNHNTCYIVRISYSGKIYTQKIINNQ
jgi:hypothetical protein